jgi:uncharacterized membrane protein
MKRLYAAIVVAVGSVGMIGCGNGSPGGPGASVRDDKFHMSTPEDSFTLSTPGPLATNIKQGEAKVITIGIKRGKNFGQDVAIKLDGLPQGVTADPSSADMKAGQDEVKVTLKAADDAALGDFTIKVAGHPAKGGDATNEFKLTVSKK